MQTDFRVEVPVSTKHLYNLLYNVGPTSLTLVQHCTNVTQMCCVCWGGGGGVWMIGGVSDDTLFFLLPFSLRFVCWWMGPHARPLRHLSAWQYHEHYHPSLIAVKYIALFQPFPGRHNVSSSSWQCHTPLASHGVKISRLLFLIFLI